MTTRKERLIKQPNTDDQLEVSLPVITEGQVVTLAYRLGDALDVHNGPQWRYIPVPEGSGISITTNKWYSHRGDDFGEERTVVLMRHGWMDAAIGSGAAVFEGNISEARAREVHATSGITPNHVIAVGAHMETATMEAARDFLLEHPNCAFETNYYVGKDGIVKVSLIPVGMDDRSGTFPDIASLSLRRIITEVTPIDVELMMAVMQGFITDIQCVLEEAAVTPKEIIDNKE